MDPEKRKKLESLDLPGITLSGKDKGQNNHDRPHQGGPFYRKIQTLIGRCWCCAAMTLSRNHNDEKDNGGGQGVLADRELKDMQSLVRYLSQAMTIPLSEHGNGEKYLECVDENGFILTLDFTMKLLRMHERVVCRTPCIVEGETGVSKTALTKMYSMLRNEGVRRRARVVLESDLEDMEKQLGSYCVEYTGGILEGISSTLSSDSQDQPSCSKLHEIG